MINIFKKLKMDKQTLIKFLIVTFSSQIIYSMWTLKGPLYNPFIEAMGITNAQLGHLFTVMGLVGTFGTIFGGFIIDRFSLRKIMAFDLVITGSLGIVMATRPSYSILLLIFIMFGLTTDCLYWSGVLKSIRVIASDKRQGTAFGAMEFVRGFTDIILASLGVFIFQLLGQKAFGITVAMMTYAVLIILAGILTWLFLPEEDFLQMELNAKKASEKNLAAFKGLLKIIVKPEVWLIGLQASGVYVCYIGMTYFVPFLQGVFSLPVLAVAIFGIINTSFMRMFASPLSGLIGDSKFGSSTKLMRILLVCVTALLGIILLIPNKPNFMIISIIALMLITISTYMLRGVYYAPIGELNFPKAHSGSAMAVAAFIGYSPQFWAYSLFGTLIDNHEATVAYTKIFTIMIAFTVFGILSSTILCKMIDKKQKLEQPST